MTDALKPCPFCGCKDIRVLPQPNGFSVNCMSCSARMLVHTDFAKQAASEWNLRLSPEET